MNFNPNAMFFFLSQTLDHRNTLHCCETFYFKRVPELKQKIKKIDQIKQPKNNAQPSALHWLPPQRKRETKQDKTDQTNQKKQT